MSLYLFCLRFCILSILGCYRQDKDTFTSLSSEEYKFFKNAMDSIMEPYYQFSTTGQGIRDMYPDSDCIKRVKQYLANTSNPVLLIGSHIKFLYTISSPSKDIIDKYEEKMEKMYSKYVGANNDLLLSLDTQIGEGIENISIERKVFQNIIHYYQIYAVDIINSIVHFVREKLGKVSIKNPKISIILMHGVTTIENNENYMNVLKPELEKHFKNTNILAPLYPNFKEIPIRDQAIDTLNRFKDVEKSDIVVLIGHSMGCIRALEVANILENRNVKTITICIGGPNKGAQGLINIDSKIKSLRKEQVLIDCLKELIRNIKVSRATYNGLTI